MKESLKKRALAAAVAAAVVIASLLAFSVKADAATYTHNSAFVAYGFCTSGMHQLTYDVNSVSGYAEAGGLSVISGYRHELVVSGTAFLSTGSACGGYYKSVDKPETYSIQAQSTPGACTGIPQSASGYARLYQCQYGLYMVRIGSPAYDYLP